MSADPKVAGDDEIVTRRPNRRLTTSPTLGEEFDPRSNALNAWRLTLATGVILWHSWPLTGRQVSFEPVHQLLRDGWVDGFFAISGFLITWSWFRRPRLRDYFLARGLTHPSGVVGLPDRHGVCHRPDRRGDPGRLRRQVATVARAVRVRPRKQRRAATQPRYRRNTTRGPLVGEWDGSLWTLFWEVLCYIAIAGLGVVGLLRRRWLIPALFALVLYWSAILPPYSAFIEAAPGARQHIDAATARLVTNGVAARFAVMFLAGALLYRFRHVIPARWSLVAVSLVDRPCGEPAAQLPCHWRHSAGLRHHRFGCSHPQQALST